MDQKLLRLSAPAISQCLTHVFNLSLFHGCLPSDFKLARITPVYKGKGDKDDPSNYRPLSVVPTVVKIFEKAVKCQLIDYLESNNLLSPSQSAYMKNRSTQTALHQIVDECMNNIDKNYANIICCLDLSKGFDTLNHEILLSKMSKYGINGRNIEWFKSYLVNRTQIVRNNSDTSSLHTVNTGVPQGTVLGPILFLLYVNDLANNVPYGIIVMYADDTSIICKGLTPQELKSNVENALKYVSKWFNDNRLVVNFNKSCILPVASAHHIKTFYNNMSIMITLNCHFVPKPNYLVCTLTRHYLSNIMYLTFVNAFHLR
jgi:hypothetical protein